MRINPNSCTDLTYCKADMEPIKDFEKIKERKSEKREVRNEEWEARREKRKSKIDKLLSKLVDFGGSGWIRTTEAIATDL